MPYLSYHFCFARNTADILVASENKVPQDAASIVPLATMVPSISVKMTARKRKTCLQNTAPMVDVWRSTF